MPAALSRCPIPDLTLPMAQKPVRSVLSRNTPVSARSSIGSPIIVPVPCASTMPIRSAVTPAAASARRTTLACAVGFGVVRPMVWPSFPVATASITAWMRSPSASASSRRFSRTIPQPSPGTKPSADSSKTAQRPRGEIAPIAENSR